jgi:predicted phosphohydrolase
VRQGPVCFVVLDTGEDKPDSDMEYSGITDYDNYRTEQARWLKEALKSKDYTEAKYRVVIAHLPPVTGRNLWHGQTEVLEKFVPVLNEANVDVMLSGHLHTHVNQKPVADIKFHVPVNMHNTVIKGVAKESQLELVFRDFDGKVVDRVVLNAK